LNNCCTVYDYAVNFYTKIYMICKIFGVDLLDFRGFNSRNFRKPILFEYNNQNKMKQNETKIFPLGDSALTVSFGDVIQPEIHSLVLSLVQRLAESPFIGLTDIVPAYTTVGVFYDFFQVKNAYQPPATIAAWVEDYIRDLLCLPILPQGIHTKTISVPVCYDTVFGFDLESVAVLHSLNTEEVIRLHTSTGYQVYLIGFLPGFAYLGAVPPQIATPRKSQPRLKVPAGSVGIADWQTGIYPFDSPAGWQIIGRTPLPLFDAEAESLTLLRVGDRVQFYRIGRAEFESMKGCIMH
jgi:inhibitor of KinA